MTTFVFIGSINQYCMMSIAEGDINLIERFNKKDKEAFGEVYSLVFSELCAFTRRLFSATEHEACDIIQDIFVSLWSNNNQIFSSISSIKAYIYISIRNRFKNHLQHKNTVEVYQQKMINDFDFFEMQVVDIEFENIIEEMLNYLPSNYAEIIKLHIEGWNIKDIAEKLQISERTIFYRKESAIKILTDKFGSKNYILLLLT